MSLSLDVLKYCIIMLVGAYLGARFSPSKPSQNVVVQQAQTSKCKAVITKRQNADGSRDEITEFLTENSQSQSIGASKKSGGLYLGAGTNLKGSISIQLDKQLHQIQTDGKKDHVYYFSYKVMEW